MPSTPAVADRSTAPESTSAEADGVGLRGPDDGVGRRSPDERVNRLTSIPFILVHLLPLLAIFTGVSTRAVVLCVVLYFGRMFFITGGYHRYFSHRSYRLNRFWQFVMAFGGGTAAQKGALWWASHHRDHHRYSDSPSDVHSPTQKGFFWSHVGWILCDKYAATDYDRIKDFSKYPELVFLNKQDWIAPWALGDRLLRDRGLERPADRLLPVDRAAVARHLHGQLAGARDGSASLRHRGHEPQLGPDRHADHG